ncbi:uncharacterized protein PAC_20157 [Phialocephala subalpina]|uniref:Glycosyl hydrolases family 39 N-terminal catalytic domain-containing protein n=1 Tax=Phialocephala subalpina TaxID=576137 RepID=A0A1L7XZ49_9HELO|nr:uncharacterized protein PAC_20157 [Phialocephala subalpina]
MAIYIFIASLLVPRIAAIPSMQKHSRSDIPVINIDWKTVLTKSKTTTTLQVVVNPLLLQNSSIHDNALKSLEYVAADYVRFVPWYPYPKLSVPEIDEPVINGDNCTTSWDFTYADPLMEDFFRSTPNVSHIINFSTTPDWMWILPNGTTYTYPDDINDIDFDYNQGTQLRDPSLKEVSDYYSRLVSWYVRGGFTDECGVYHHSGHTYEIEYWEVLNEIEAEHSIQPAFYNQLYDTIVTAIRAVSPNTKFVGLALANAQNLSYFEEFLDPSKHAVNIPLDFISYHFYGSPDEASTEAEAAQCFQQAETFLNEVSQIETIRKQLSPSTKTTLNEIGTFDPQGAVTIVPGYEVPAEYFIWSGGVFAYVFSRIAAMGIDVIGESQLVGYPGQFPSVSMVDYTTGLPNARLRVLQLIQESFAPGDELVQTNYTSESNIHAQAFVTTDGVRKLLLINKLRDAVTIQIWGLKSAKIEIVDVSTGGDIWRTEDFSGSVFNITGWATAVMTEN